MSGSVWAIAALVFAASLGLTSWLASTRSRLLDRPNERSLHERPTPRTGGVAFVLSSALGAALLGLTGHPQRVLLLGLALGLAGLSFIDDWRGLSAGVRFGCHGVAAFLAAWLGDARLDQVAVPGLGTFHLGAAAIPVSVLALMWMTNLYNFMDGMDGFAGGMTVSGLAVLAALGWPAFGPIALVAAGAAAGFLCRNFPPARIFLGDVGSIPIGFLCGALSLVGVRERLFDAWVPLLAFSPFVVDATVTLVRRAWRRVKVWQAHREHYYQRLVLAGWGHRNTVLAEYALMLAAGGSALLYARSHASVQAALLASWAVVYAFLAISIGRRLKPRASGAG